MDKVFDALIQTGPPGLFVVLMILGLIFAAGIKAGLGMAKEPGEDEMLRRIIEARANVAINTLTKDKVNKVVDAATELLVKGAV